MRHGRRAAGVVLVTALGASLAACGGSDEPTTSGPTSAAPTSASASPSASASATPSDAPPALSRFEDEPAVQAARAWAKALATDINNADTTFAASAPLTTKEGRKGLDFYTKSDIAAKLQYPGPLPFTPVRIREAGSTTTVVTCTWTDGWGLDPATQKPKDKRVVQGEDFVMKKTAKGFKLSRFNDHAIDCSDVNVKGVPG
jgi:hypothetical protein